jgi:hypothetical protein
VKVLLNKNNVVYDFGKDIVFAKPGAEDGGLIICEEAEATHIWNREKNTAVMSNSELSGLTMIEVEEVPEEIERNRYKYVDGEFVIDEEYVPYVPMEERVAMLEDVINEMLLG